MALSFYFILYSWSCNFFILLKEDYISNLLNAAMQIDSSASVLQIMAGVINADAVILVCQISFQLVSSISEIFVFFLSCKDFRIWLGLSCVKGLCTLLLEYKTSFCTLETWVLMTNLTRFNLIS